MRFIILLLFLSLHGFVYSQQVSIYFGNDEHQLNAENISKLNLVIGQLDTSKNYLVELGGYADSTATRTYNMELAAKRIQSVRATLSEKLAGEKTRYKTINHGEDFPFLSSGKTYEKTLNRKVDLCFTEVTSDFKLLYTAPNGIKMKVGINDADSCSVCENGNRLHTYMESARVLRVEVGRNCPYSKEAPCFENEIRVPGEYYRSISGTRACKVDIFRLCGSTALPDTLYHDTGVDEYVFHFNCFYGADICCGTLNCRLGMRLPAFTTNRLIYRTQNKKHEKIIDDSLHIQAVFCDGLEILSIGKIDNRYYTLHTLTTQLKPDDGSFYPTLFYTIPLNLYSALQYCDTLLKVKVRNGKKGDQVAFYLPEFKYHLPIKQIRKKKHQDYITVENYELSINEKFNDQGYKVIRAKYRKKKKQLKIVVRKTIDQ